MALFRTVDGVVLRFDTNGNPINDDGSPRAGATLAALGGADGTIDPSLAAAAAAADAGHSASTQRAPTVQAPGAGASTPAPLQPTSFANLNIQLTDAATRTPLADATVLISPDFGNGTTRTTDGNGFANFGVGVGYDVEINILKAGYSNNDHVIHIADTSDHWYAVSLVRGAAAPAPGSGSPPGVPPAIILVPGGAISPLDVTPSGLAGVAPAHAAARFSTESRGGVPSLTAESFSALDVGAFGPSPSGIFTTIVGALIGLFKSSSGSAEINRLTGVVQNIGNLLLQTVSTLADLAARSVHTDTQGGNIFEHILGGVLGPIINALASVIRGGSADLGKLFGPITGAIKSLVGAVRRIYDNWLKPILKAIDTTRQILRVLEAFHLKWATEADAALGRLEGKLSAPLLLAIKQLNKVSNVVNTIVTLDGALQRVTLIKGLTQHATCVQRAVVNAWMPDPSTVPDSVTPLASDATVAAMVTDYGTFVQAGTSPELDDFDDWNAQLQQELAGAG